MDLEHELVSAISRTKKDGRFAAHWTRHLLRNDGKSDYIIGVTHEGIVYVWNSALWGLDEIELPDSDTAQEMERMRVEGLDALCAVEDWIREHQSEFEWIHPRFAWLMG